MGTSRLEIQLLRYVADPRVVGPAHRAVIRNRPDQRSQQHGLTGCIRSEDRQRVSTRDDEAEIAQHDRCPEADRESTHLQRVVHVHLCARGGGMRHDVFDISVAPLRAGSGCDAGIEARSDGDEHDRCPGKHRKIRRHQHA